MHILGKSTMLNGHPLIKHGHPLIYRYFALIKHGHPLIYRYFALIKHGHPLIYRYFARFFLCFLNCATQFDKNIA